MSFLARALKPKATIKNLRSKVARVRHDDRLVKNRSRPIFDGVVLYEAYDGSGVLCNPAAIFRNLLSSPEYSNLLHVWVLRHDTDIAKFKSKYARQDRVTCVKYRSRKYFEFLGRAQYLINNSSFPVEFMKREDQTYINTWHGVPLKQMGYEVPNGRADTRNVVRNFLSADYLISSSSNMTDSMFASAFKLANIYAGKILEVGQPRTDIHFADGSETQDTLRRLAEVGLDAHGKKVVLFAPTWRGANPYSVDPEEEDVFQMVLALQERLGEEYVVVSKFHQLAERKLSAEARSRIGLVDASWDTNELLRISDHLVTDYSSLMFDYLSLNRPVHFYIPENDDYAEVRGVYRDPSEFPGAFCSSALELAASITGARSKDYSKQRQQWVRDYVPLDDGNAASRVVETVFGGKPDSARVIELAQTKIKILIHVGSLIPNGITTAALNLLKNINYEIYDVTVMYPYSSRPYQFAKSLEIDSRARLLPRIGRVSMRALDRKSYWAFNKGGGTQAGDRHVRKMPEIFKDEFRRCAGNSTFDLALGFDGYQVFWTELILQAGANRKYLWAHNDLSLDAHRIVRGGKPHLDNLTSVFTLYSKFDGIVSVTDELCEINRTKLIKYSGRDNFVSLSNFIDDAEILVKSNEEFDEGIYGAGPNYITVGRLSPEKNQARIIRSFASVCRDFPEAKLIIVGDGPLKLDLMNLATDLGIEGNVEFTGLLNNPYPYVKAADCFVFASEYEGQGLVILEALILRVPVISTRFNVVDAVLKPGDGIIVEPSDQTLTDAMKLFAKEGLPEPVFNAQEYNNSLRAKLESLLAPL